jgi:O-antigen ligase
VRAFRRRGEDRGVNSDSRPGSGPVGVAIATEGPAGHVRHTTTADFPDLWRPATVVLLVVPVILLGGGTSTVGRLAVVAVVAAAAALAPAAAALVAMGVLPFRQSYLWIVLFASLLLVSFAFPEVRTSVTVPPDRHQIADFLGMLRGLPPAQLIRFSDLVELLAGLALLGITLASSPHPRQVARVIALSGMLAAGYVLVRGGFDNGRLEGLGSNPNYLGFLLALPLVAAVGLIRYARNPRWLVPAAVCFIALFDTHSRGAFLAAAAGVALVFVQGRSWRFLALLMSVVVSAGGAAAAVGMLRSLARHIVNFGAGDRSITDLGLSNGLRARVAAFAVRVVVEHPLRGIGYAIFPSYAQRSPDFGVYLGTHNEYLRLAAEAGVLTLVVFLVLLWMGMARRQAGDLAVLRAVVLAYMVILLFANPLARLIVSVPFWVALGCLLASRPRPAPGTRGPAIAVKVARAVWGGRRIAPLFRSRRSRGGSEPHARQPSRSPQG